MKKTFPVLVFISIFAACTSTPEADRAAEDTAWDFSDQINHLNNMTVAVGEFEATDIPATLVELFRDELTTSLAIAFRENNQNHRVVTRDKVDAIHFEQALELEGLTYNQSQIRIGQVLGADILVLGNIIRLEGDIYRGKFQMIETSTGIVLGGTSWDFWFDAETGG